ncbi:MAG: sugar phosphate isomerase/epimerase [Chloroflexi bacterium]|nr:MAG: sugar phosphate isomerase/epimerase [Chloroflexota bacterium]MBL1196475.1 sugar phosphate isomerase/epimerase [Chloroflexota bacterium]NOH13770.1 sugar phosphate isomerase/epimerase [Chloroflexota bacterium]
MQFGANTFIWRSPFSTDNDLDLIDKLKEMGFDRIEVAVEDPALVDLAALKAALEKSGMKAIMCGAFGPGRNLSSLDPGERANAEAYLKWMIDAAAELDAGPVIGPMYSAVGKDRLEDEAEREQEWGLAVSGLKEMCKYAAERGVRLAFEPLNRFETDMVNVIEQGLKLIADVGEPNLGMLIDTFHMHLEEKDSATAIRTAGDRVFHVHAAENDRGVPGTGQVDWVAAFEALKDINYQGVVSIESFTPEVKSIARAVCIWREIAPDQDTIAREGLKHLKSLPGVA